MMIGSRLRIDSGLSLDQVSRFYRGGQTRERIRQIEIAHKPSVDVERDYYAAVDAALADVERKRKLFTRVKAELAKEKEEKKISGS
jgi:hypothetical protein